MSYARAPSAAWLGRSRFFRYEVRRWRGGVIPDVSEAVAARRAWHQQSAGAASAGAGPRLSERYLGTRRTGYRRDVELELPDFLAARQQRALSAPWLHLSAAVHLDGLPGSLLRAGIPARPAIIERLPPDDPVRSECEKVPRGSGLISEVVPRGKLICAGWGILMVRIGRVLGSVLVGYGTLQILGRRAVPPRRSGDPRMPGDELVARRRS